MSVYYYGQPEKRLNLIDENGAPSGQTFEAVTAIVSRPDRPPALSEVDPETRLEVELGDDISLVGASLPQQVIVAGGPTPSDLALEGGAGTGGRCACTDWVN